MFVLGIYVGRRWLSLFLSKWWWTGPHWIMDIKKAREYKDMQQIRGQTGLTLYPPFKSLCFEMRTHTILCFTRAFFVFQIGLVSRSPKIIKFLDFSFVLCYSKPWLIGIIVSRFFYACLISQTDFSYERILK